MITMSCNYCPEMIKTTDVEKAVAWSNVHVAAHANQTPVAEPLQDGSDG